MKMTSTIPDGLVLVEDYITKEEEKQLIDYIDSQPWNTQIARRTQGTIGSGIY